MKPESHAARRVAPLLIQPQPLRGSSNPLSLRRVIGKHLEATGERPLGKFAFAKNYARSDQLNPSVGVARRLFQAIGKAIDHFSYHDGAIRRPHCLSGLHVLWPRSPLNFPARLRSTLYLRFPVHSWPKHWLRLFGTRTTIDANIAA